eukprot:SAG11_NODE_3652_length_2310_cov_1.113071_1_plen_222_part_10
MCDVCGVDCSADFWHAGVEDGVKAGEDGGVDMCNGCFSSPSTEVFDGLNFERVMNGATRRHAKRPAKTQPATKKGGDRATAVKGDKSASGAPSKPAEKTKSAVRALGPPPTTRTPPISMPIGFNTKLTGGCPGPVRRSGERLQKTIAAGGHRWKSAEIRPSILVSCAPGRAGGRGRQNGQARKARLRRAQKATERLQKAAPFEERERRAASKSCYRLEGGVG